METLLFLCFCIFFLHTCVIYFPASGQAVVTGVVPSPPRFLPSIFITPRVQQSHCSSIFHRVLLTHALAFSASQFVRKKKSTRIYTSMHSGRFTLSELTYTRLEDNLIRHQGDRLAVRARDVGPRRGVLCCAPQRAQQASPSGHWLPRRQRPDHRASCAKVLN